MKKQTKEIIGYKAPFNIDECEIKKGDVVSRYEGTGIYCIIDGKKHTFHHALPPEIVEKWEPVYNESATASSVQQVSEVRMTEEILSEEVSTADLYATLLYAERKCKQNEAYSQNKEDNIERNRLWNKYNVIRSQVEDVLEKRIGGEDLM